MSPDRRRGLRKLSDYEISPDHHPDYGPLSVEALFLTKMVEGKPVPGRVLAVAGYRCSVCSKPILTPQAPEILVAAAFYRHLLFNHDDSKIKQDPYVIKVLHILVDRGELEKFNPAKWQRITSE